MNSDSDQRIFINSQVSSSKSSKSKSLSPCSSQKWQNDSGSESSFEEKSLNVSIELEDESQVKGEKELKKGKKKNKNQAKNEKKKEKKNKIPKVKVLNKLVDVGKKRFEEVEEFEFLRDELLDFDVRNKKKALPDFAAGQNTVPKSTNSLAQSVLFNEDPNSLLVVEKPKDVAGVLCKNVKSSDRDKFLHNLKCQVSDNKYKRLETSSDNPQSFLRSSSNDYKIKAKASAFAGGTKNKFHEISPNSINYSEKEKTDLENSQENLKTTKKTEIDPETLVTRYDLKVFDQDINLKRDLIDEEKPLKSLKSKLTCKQSSNNLNTDDIEHNDYDEEKHIGKIRMFRQIKEVEKVKLEESCRIDEGYLEMINKPEKFVSVKSLIGSEALEKFKPTEAFTTKPSSFFKAHSSEVKKSDKENKSVHPKRKSKKNLLFLLK